MSQILAIQGSPRGERSHSRRLLESFLSAWQDSAAGRDVVRREVGRAQIPPVSEAWIAAAFHPAEQRDARMQADLALSESLIGELFTADRLVIATPMYNFGVPSGLKAWIDQVVRIGRTFDFDPEDHANPYRPRVLGKKALIVTTRGDHGYGPGAINAHRNHADTYLRTVLGFIGIEDVTVIAVEDDEYGGQSFADSYGRAERALAELAGSF
ncbi:FMN-dependent NADH-azoreductase [Zestomonas carbonaria]|uniref:FMN dependent NADH:quinone oxidoreductase n=1 Tax=Zestomonas carbonaria TaxID=2762745 RepID=A0A7U7IA99_9GAMM|nr:NAD(P)H-dependent oxidoreductase [Pseudomonas carbonaria]CAD5109135.1 FMN-dependent NADH-azoreductase 1 [Pseudomonas carbonaria]